MSESELIMVFRALARFFPRNRTKCDYLFTGDKYKQTWLLFLLLLLFSALKILRKMSCMKQVHLEQLECTASIAFSTTKRHVFRCTGFTHVHAPPVHRIIIITIINNARPGFLKHCLLYYIINIYYYIIVTASL